MASDDSPKEIVWQPPTVQVCCPRHTCRELGGCRLYTSVSGRAGPYLSSSRRNTLQVRAAMLTKEEVQTRSDRKRQELWPKGEEGKQIKEKQKKRKRKAKVKDPDR